MKRSEAVNLRQIIEAASQSLADEMALDAICLHPLWASGVAYAVGNKVQHNGKLWRAVQEHTAQDGWQPGNAAALWEQINEAHTGERGDPIPYSGNMALEKDKYYIEKSTTYLCVRDTINPVFNKLSELVGVYVEEVG